MNTESDRRRRFEELAAEVYEPLQRYLRRRATPDDADDAFSETLLTLWRRLDDVPDDASLPWSYGVARRVLANQRRSRRRHLHLVDRIAVSPEASETAPGPDAGDDFPEVRAALDALPDPDREVLTLWAWEDLAPREIAIVLDTTPNAISLRLTRARAKLEAELRRQDPGGAGQEPVESPRSTDHE